MKQNPPPLRRSGFRDIGVATVLHQAVERLRLKRSNHLQSLSLLQPCERIENDGKWGSPLCHEWAHVDDQRFHRLIEER